jgi:hypothetical protein
LACAELDDRDRSAVLYDQLLPHAHRCVGIGASLCLGSAHLPLGMLAAVAGCGPANDHFLAAIEMHERLDARPLVAEARFQWGRARARAADVDGAREQFEQAAAGARALGMTALARRCQSAGGEEALLST